MQRKVTPDPNWWGDTAENRRSANSETRATSSVNEKSGKVVKMKDMHEENYEILDLSRHSSIGAVCSKNFGCVCNLKCNEKLIVWLCPAFQYPLGNK